MSYRIVAIGTEAELTDHAVDVPGDYLRVLAVPASVALYLSVGATVQDPIRLRPGDTLEARECEGWTTLRIRTEGTDAAGEILLFVGCGMRLPAAGSDGVAYGLTAAGAAVPLLVDDAGQQYVRLADRLQSDLDAVTVRNEGDYLNALAVRLTDPEIAEASITAANNAVGLRLALELGSRERVDLWASLGAAGDVRVQVSPDGAAWRTVEEAALAAPGEFYRSIRTAYRWVSIFVPTVGIDVELEASAK